MSLVVLLTLSMMTRNDGGGEEFQDLVQFTRSLNRVDREAAPSVNTPTSESLRVMA